MEVRPHGPETKKPWAASIYPWLGFFNQCFLVPPERWADVCGKIIIIAKPEAEKFYRHAAHLNYLALSPVLLNFEAGITQAQNDFICQDNN